MPKNGAARDIHRPLTDVFSASFDEISAEQAKMAFFRLNSPKACAKLLELKQRRRSGRCRRSCDNSAPGTPAATFYCRISGIGFFMPLSSSVPRAKRHERTIVVVPAARSHGMWALMGDLDQRIADVNVRTGAHALSEVTSRLLYRCPTSAFARAAI